MLQKVSKIDCQERRFFNIEKTNNRKNQNSKKYYTVLPITAEVYSPALTIESFLNCWIDYVR